MRPVRDITPDEQNHRIVEFAPGMFSSKVDGIQPEPVGTIIVTAFRITGYRPDCDGSLMAELEHIDRDGNATGWTENSVGLYPDTDLVVTPEEWAAMFQKSDNT